MDMIWLMLALASLAIAYVLAVFKKYRKHLEVLLGNLATLSQENARLQDELSEEMLSKEEDQRKIEDGKKQIEANTSKIGELEDRIKNAKTVQETLQISSQSWKLDR